MNSNSFQLLKTRPFAIGLLACFGMLITGCSSFTTNPTEWFSQADVAEVEIPDRILPIWTDTVLHQPGQKGVRGFGGRIYFYEGGDEKPVAVDGNITVYAFDGDFKADDPSKPLKKYIVTAEQLKDLQSTTKLGVSYNIWIPWEEVGGASRKLTLIARFDGTLGGTVISDSSTKLLPGIDSTPDHYQASRKSKTDSDSFPVKQASFTEEPTRQPELQQNNTTIFSIDLPSSLERKINSAGKPSSSVQQGDSAKGGLDELDPKVSTLFGNAIPIKKFNPSELPNQTDTDSKPESDNSTGQVFSGGARVSTGKVGSPARTMDLQSRFGYQSHRFQAQSQPATQQAPSLLRMTPHPASWQSGLPPTPRSNR